MYLSTESQPFLRIIAPNAYLNEGKNLFLISFRIILRIKSDIEGTVVLLLGLCGHCVDRISFKNASYRVEQRDSTVLWLQHFCLSIRLFTLQHPKPPLLWY